jgi:hypothetical protein
MEWWHWFLVGVGLSVLGDVIDYIKARVQGLPTPGQLRRLGRLIRAEANCKPHTAEWGKARDAVTVAAMQLADSIRGEAK